MTEKEKIVTENKTRKRNKTSKDLRKRREQLIKKTRKSEGKQRNRGSEYEEANENKKGSNGEREKRNIQVRFFQVFYGIELRKFLLPKTSKII